MRKILMLCGFVVGCASCSPSIDPNVTIKDDITLCSPACESVQDLGCPEGSDLVYPTSCVEDTDCEFGICIDSQCTETCLMVCEALVKEGRQLGLECWQEISSCEDIELVCRQD